MFFTNNLQDKDAVFTLSIRELLSIYLQRPVKDESQEFKALKDLFGEDTALAVSNDEKVRNQIEDKLFMDINPKNAIGMSRCRDLHTTMDLKSMEYKGIPIYKPALFDACDKAKKEYDSLYTELEAKCKDKNYELTPDFIRGEGRFPAKLREFNELLGKTRKAWKHTLLLNKDMLADHISEKDGWSWLHCDFENNASVTGRIQTHSPNVQGLPKEVRANSFVPPYGYALISADYISEELVIMAVLAGDQELLDDIVNGVDLHTRTAAILFNQSADKITQQQRSVAKKMTFATLYGAGAATLEANACSYGFTLNGNKIKKAVKEVYPSLGILSDQVKRTNKLTMIDGSTIPCSSVKKSYTYVNRMVQGSGSIILKEAFCILSRSLFADMDIVCLIHDEIIVLTPVSEIEECVGILHDVMTNILDRFNINIKMPVDIKVTGMTSMKIGGIQI